MAGRAAATANHAEVQKSKTGSGVSHVDTFGYFSGRLTGG
jgi:hypothetical protein